MKLIIKSILAGTFFVLCTTAFMPAEKHFSTIEQQQVSTATKGLFSQGNSFSVDFGNVSPQEYSFPLPIGKAKLISNNSLEITTSKGDVVKAMFKIRNFKIHHSAVALIAAAVVIGMAAFILVHTHQTMQ
nr:hypothetical protein [Prevotella sp.]